MVVRDGTGKEYHSVEIQLESVLIPKEKIESKSHIQRWSRGKQANF